METIFFGKRLVYEHKRADVSSVGPIGRTEVLKLFLSYMQIFRSFFLIIL